MRLYPAVMIIMLIIILLPDILIFLQLKQKKKLLIAKIFWFFPTIVFIGFIIWHKATVLYEYNATNDNIKLWMNFAFLLIYVPKFIYLLFYFLNFLINKVFKSNIRFITHLGLLFCIVIIFNLIIGAFYTPNNYKLKKVTVYIKDLPLSFENYKIIHISDIHLGSWNYDFEKIEPVINIVNSQYADIIIFSGDLVNNYSEETLGWEKYFIRLKSKSGNFAILGNHDYGDYSSWKIKDDKTANLNRIKKSINSFGFRLLLNENTTLHKGNDSISLIGVENWGKKPFPKYGDLKKALEGIPMHTVKVLLSHDPSHWTAEVLDKEDIALTLAGHTHAAQMGITIGNKLYSPSSIIYKQFDGLYQKNHQFLYVNRGLGYIGLPIRIGVPPEITLLELKKAKQ